MGRGPILESLQWGKSIFLFSPKILVPIFTSHVLGYDRLVHNMFILLLLTHFLMSSWQNQNLCSTMMIEMNFLFVSFICWSKGVIFSSFHSCTKSLQWFALPNIFWQIWVTILQGAIENYGHQSPRSMCYVPHHALHNWKIPLCILYPTYGIAITPT